MHYCFPCVTIPPFLLILYGDSLWSRTCLFFLEVFTVSYLRLMWQTCNATGCMWWMDMCVRFYVMNWHVSYRHSFVFTFNFHENQLINFPCSLFTFDCHCWITVIWSLSKSQQSRRVAFSARQIDIGGEWRTWCSLPFYVKNIRKFLTEWLSSALE